jgi:hypothetical protein
MVAMHCLGSGLESKFFGSCGKLLTPNSGGAKLSRMKILCPCCELWLVELIVSDGEGSFYCLRCDKTNDGSLL